MKRIALALYLLALLPRLLGISSPAPEPDEVHWLMRSGGIIEQFEAGKYSQLTTHLTHPGVPAGCVMAAGQIVADFYNAARGFGKKDAGYVDRLAGSRIANAVFSSLLIPLVFLGCANVCGGAVALLAAMLLAFDPRHIGMSRIAHIDSVLTVFVALSLGLYLCAVARRSVVLKLLAGASWGLAIATKPTAIALIPTFLGFKWLLSRLDRKRWVLNEPLIAWSDLWAVMAGHLILALIYTRLWPHDSDYLHRIAVRSSVADFIWCGSMRGRELGSLFTLFVATTVFVPVRAGWKLWRGDRCWLHQLQLLAGVLLFAVFVYPAVCENIVRFWCWVAGLSEVKHAAYNRVMPPPPGGYLGLLLVRLPSVALISFLAGLVLLVLNARRMFDDSRSAGQAAVLVMAAAGLVAWICLLSVSSKQTIRYLVPAFPGVYLIAAFGVMTVARRVAATKLSVQRMLCGVVALLQMNAVARVHPFYELFFNDLSGGLAGASKRGHPLPLAEPAELFDTLLTKMRERKQGLSIGIIGDVESIRLEAKRRGTGERLIFHPETDAHVSDFVLATGWRLREHEEHPEVSVLGQLKPLQEIRFEGVRIAALYELPWPSYAEPYHFDVVKFHRPTGREVRVDGARIVGAGESVANARSVVAALPALDQKGFLLSGFGVRLPAGDFKLSLDITVPDLHSFTDRSPDRLVLRLNFGKGCEHAFSLAELPVGERKTVTIPCRFDEAKRPQITAYWFGKVPVLIEDLTLEEAER